MKKGVLRDFTKFTRKHRCQSLFFNKVGGLRPATLLKKGLWHRCFPVNFKKFLRTPFFYRTPLVAVFESGANHRDCYNVWRFLLTFNFNYFREGSS